MMGFFTQTRIKLAHNLSPTRTGRQGATSRIDHFATDAEVSEVLSVQGVSNSDHSPIKVIVKHDTKRLMPEAKTIIRKEVKN